MMQFLCFGVMQRQWLAFYSGCEILIPILNWRNTDLFLEPLKTRNYLELCDEARSSGCLVFLSHPFDLIRQNWVYKKRNGRKPIFIEKDFRKNINGLECINARNLILSSNRYATSWANDLNLSKVGGSDAFAMEIAKIPGLLTCNNGRTWVVIYILDEIRNRITTPARPLSK